VEYLFIHGHGQNSSSWDKTLSYLDKRYNFTSLDLLTLINDKEATYENLYKGFSEYCNKISDPINLCGLSLGGLLSLNYVLDYPEKINTLILIGTPDKIPNFLFKIQIGIFKIMPESVFQHIGYKKKDFMQILSSLVNFDLSKNLKSILCSTLIIRGNKDIFNIKASKRLAENIQNSNLVIIENSGHTVNTDNPKQLALEIVKFYEQYK